MYSAFLPATSIPLAVAIPLGLLSSYIIFAIVTAIANIYLHPLSKFPGPRTRAAFAFPDVLSYLRGTGHVNAKQLHDQYGSVVRVGPNALSFNTAEAWKDIYGLKKDRSQLEKDPEYYRKGTAVQILTGNSKEHARFRKLLAPAFSDSALLEQEPLLNHYFELLVQKLREQIDGPSKGRVDLMAQYSFLTFDVISDLALGEPFGVLESGEYHMWMRNFFEAIKLLGIMRLAFTYPLYGLFFQLLMRLKPSFTAKRRAHMQFTKQKVDERLNRNTERKDFLQYILRSGKGTEQSLSHDEVLGNSRVILTAGSDTTSTHLCGATWYLLTHRAALFRAQSEVRNAFLKADDITLRSVSASGSLPFLNAVIEETLRCYPSVPSTLPRITGPGGSIIDGRFIPANTSVGVNHWSASHSASNFAAADDFMPERWLTDEAPIACSRDKKDAMQPFSLGPRACIGKSLAYFEIRSVLTRMLWHFDMQLEEESRDWIVQKQYALWDKPSLWVRMTRRTA